MPSDMDDYSSKLGDGNTFGDMKVYKILISAQSLKCICAQLENIPNTSKTPRLCIKHTPRAARFCTFDARRLKARLPMLKTCTK